jgi:hypothetical protein
MDAWVTKPVTRHLRTMYELTEDAMPTMVRVIMMILLMMPSMISDEYAQTHGFFHDTSLHVFGSQQLF